LDQVSRASQRAENTIQVTQNCSNSGLELSKSVLNSGFKLDDKLRSIRNAIQEALKVVLKKALISDGLVRGLRECAKALDRKEAHLCILAKDCDDKAYRKLITALCKNYNVSLLEIPTREELGDWSGLFKLDEEDNHRRKVKTSCVVIRNYGETSPELDLLLSHLGKK